MADILKIKNPDGSWTSIPAIIGPQGEPGPAGQNYVITEDDYNAIAAIAVTLLPNADEVSY